MNTQYRKNLKAVAQACKDYTDEKIKKVYYDIGHNDISTEDHIDEASYKITAPANAKLLMLQSIGGNTVKYNPSIASDSTKAMIKTMPSTVYTFDGSKFYGDSEVSENKFAIPDIAEHTTSGITWRVQNGVFYLNGTANASFSINLLQYCTLTTNVNIKFFDIQGTSTKSSITQINSVYSAPTTSGTSIENLTIFRFFTDSGQSFTNYSFKIMVVSGTTPASAWSQGFANIHNIELTGIRSESQNILPISDVAETTYNGITYKAVGGKIYAKRTSAYANNVEIYFARNISLTGSFNLFSNYSNENLYYRTSETSYTSSINQTKTNITIDRLSLVFGAEFNQTNYIELTPMFVYGSVAPTTYAPYVAPTTKTIDLSTILYNGSPLFEGNSLKGVGTAKDYITPYKAHKEVILTTNTTNFYYVDGYTIDNVEYAHFRMSIVQEKLPKGSTLNILSNYNFDYIGGGFAQRSGNWIGSANSGNTAWAFQLSMPVSLVGNTNQSIRDYFTANPLILVYELATPIEVNIDWASTLRGIQGYPNGSIIAENTNNMEVESVITYNSIIQETLCGSVTVEGANRFDKSTVLNRTYINSNGSLITETTDGWITSQPIEIEDSISFNFNTIQARYRLLDDSQNYIANSYVSTTNASGTITNSVNAKYIQFSIRINDKDTFMISKGSSIPTTFRPYKPSITRNLPTQTSDGYSAGTSRNYRVFCDDEGNEVLKRETNVDKNILGDDTWEVLYGGTANEMAVSYDISTDVAKPSVSTDVANILTTDFTTASVSDVYTHQQDNITAIGTTGTIAIYSSLLIGYSASVIKTFLANVPFYYELADASKSETDMDDFDYFFDVEEGDVITFNNPYAQQVYATYSFLIKEAKSNE